MIGTLLQVTAVILQVIAAQGDHSGSGSGSWEPPVVVNTDFDVGGDLITESASWEKSWDGSDDNDDNDDNNADVRRQSRLGLRSEETRQKRRNVINKNSKRQPSGYSSCFAHCCKKVALIHKS